jgi:uncharacterized PurR-regulated membrane protein YhhQ (DUF165 family)
MQRRSLFAGFMAGLVAAVVMMIVFSAGPEVPRAMAQSPAAEAPAASPRYQISAWANSGGHGAFVINAQTGDIWQYDRPNAPLRRVGKVPAE